MSKKKQVLPIYNFDEPIKIVRYRGGATDIVFYSLMLAIVTGAIFLILFWQNGKIVFQFTLLRVLIAFPLTLLFVIFSELLRELRKYTKKLMQKSTWTIEELMEMTGQNRKRTEQSISHVLETGFTVDPRCIKNWEELKNVMDN
ncbi:MAG: hypothetical protein IKI74_04330 [Christensenellaceae bacterium]|nr:hypothetical protein [Christensenellaceae bacterium]